MMTPLTQFLAELPADKMVVAVDNARLHERRRKRPLSSPRVSPKAKVGLQRWQASPSNSSCSPTSTTSLKAALSVAAASSESSAPRSPVRRGSITLSDDDAKSAMPLSPPQRRQSSDNLYSAITAAIESLPLGDMMDDDDSATLLELESMGNEDSYRCDDETDGFEDEDNAQIAVLAAKFPEPVERKQLPTLLPKRAFAARSG